MADIPAKIDARDVFQFNSPESLTGAFTVPGDKSISHRAIIFGSLATGETRISGFLRSEDCLATLEVMRSLGVDIDDRGDEIIIQGAGLHGLQVADKDLDCGNAGTAMRLLSGLLAAQPFGSTLVGDGSLSVRPMGRVIKPLSEMGARIESDDQTAPLTFKPATQLKAINYNSPIASAQVKSAVLIAGLYAEGVTTVTEPHKSRDHTETMLAGFGCDVKVNGLQVSVKGLPKLTGQCIQVPADISSAAFLMVLGLCHTHADFVLQNVSINPTRDGVVKILQAMGGKLTLLNPKNQAGEPVADIRVQSSKLNGIDVPIELIPSAIDEFPVLFIAAALAHGETRLTGAEELRHKESDRIQVMIDGLRLLGIDCHELPDGAIIRGGKMHSGLVDGSGDHRCAMSFLLAGALQPKAQIAVKGCHNIGTSFPVFFELIESMGIEVEQPVPVVTVDGPSGVGKGTTSALLADHLNWHLLDSGAIYRALALKAELSGVATDDEAALIELASQLQLEFSMGADQSTEVKLDGQVVNEALRSEANGERASKIAPIPAVRAALMQRQKDFQQAPGLVADGRDMGTVVFQSAHLKVFLTANSTERAKRRFKQLQARGVDVKIRDLLEDIEARDLRDSTRKVAPLVPATDAHVIDTSELSIEQVLAQVIQLVRQHIHLPGQN